MDKQQIKHLFDYKLHLTIFLISFFSISMGFMGIKYFSVLQVISFPLILALFLAVLFYLIKSFNWISDDQSKTASSLLLLIICPLLAKLAIASGPNINILFDVGPALLLKELGSIGTIVFALPIALFLGFKREVIGMVSSICREPQLGVLIDKYGFDSDEVRGFFIVYLSGIVLGTLFISLIVHIMLNLLPLHPFSYALASGIGSTSISVTILSSLSAEFPMLSNKILALGGVSNLISVLLGIYVFIFISLPITEWLYNKFEHYFNQK